jgi:hypothetical protein
MESLQPSRSITQNDEELEQSRLLEQVVAKVVRVAQRVGVSPEDIASLLDSGVSVLYVLAFLASKTLGVT